MSRVQNPSILPDARARDAAVRARHATVQVVIVGLFIEALSLANVWLFPLLRLYKVPLIDLSKLTRHEPMSGLGYVAAVVTLLIGYLIALKAVRELEGQRALLLVAGFALAFSVTLFFVYSWAAADLYDYAAAGGVLGWYGLNPFQVPASNVVGDPWVSFAPWTSTTIAYGPFWALIAGGITWAAGKTLLPNILAFKALSIVAYWAVIVLFAHHHRSEPRKAAYAILFFAWNPLVLVEALINGHNDMVMVAFLVLAVLLLRKGHLRWALVALAGSVLIKFVTILLVPLFLVYAWNQRRDERSRPTRSVLDLVAIAAPVALMTLPFIGGQDTFDLARRAQMFTTSLPTVFVAVASHWFDANRAEALAQSVAAGVLVSLCLYQTMRLRSGRSNIEATSFDVLWGYLVLACTWFQPWYLIWLVGLAALFTDSRRAARVYVFVLMALLSYFIFGFVWPQVLSAGPTLLGFRAFAGALVMVPQLGFWLWQSTRRKTQLAA